MTDDRQGGSSSGDSEGYLDSSEEWGFAAGNADAPARSGIPVPEGEGPPQNPSGAATRPTPETRKGAACVTGLARHVAVRPEAGEPPMQVLTFRVERYDQQGNRLQPIAVEMRGSRIRGAVTEGEQVEVQGVWRDGILEADKVNTSAGSTVEVPGWSKAAKIILLIVVALVLAGGGMFLAALWQGAQLWPGAQERTVPRVVGLEHREAIDEFMDAEFTLSNLDFRGNPFCRVVRTDPEAGQTVSEGEEVLVYSEPTGNDPQGCQ